MLLLSAEGQLLFHTKSGVWENIEKNATIEIVEEEKFNAEMRVRGHDGNDLLKHYILEINPRAEFDHQGHAFLWHINCNDPAIPNSTMVFVFRDEIEFTTWTNLFVHKATEATKQDCFEKSFPNLDDQRYAEQVAGLHSAYYDSPEEEPMMDFDSDSSCSDVEYDPVNTPKKSATPDRNRAIASAIQYDRVFVPRGNKLGVFRHGRDELEYVGSVQVTDKSGDVFSPSKAILHRADRHALLLNDDAVDRMYSLDLEAGRVVSEYKAGGDRPIRGMSNITKYGQKTDSELILGVNNNSVFTLDGRMGGSDQYANGNTYKTKGIALQGVTSTGAGHIAIGSKTGDIRLLNDVSKRAKSLFPGIGHAITHLDTTEDGRFVLATTKTYLLLVDTTAPDGEYKSGYEKSMSKKPKNAPKRLTIRNEDRDKHGITELSFTDACFDTGDNIREGWIISGTGNHIISWDLKRVLRGATGAYTIKRCAEYVVADKFRHNQKNEVVVATLDDVSVSSRAISKKARQTRNSRTYF